MSDTERKHVVLWDDAPISIAESDAVHCIHHHPCADGFASALLVSLVFPDAKFHPCDYGDEPPEIPDGATLLILDFSFERAILDAYADRCCLFVLDHHESSERQLKGAPYARFDNEHSGCVLTHQFLFGHSLTFPKQTAPDSSFYRALLAIEDRDLWAFKRDGTREFGAAIRSLPWDFDEWHKAFDEFAATVEAGRTVLQFRDRLCEQWLPHCGYVRLQGHVGVCIPSVLRSIFSELSERMLEKHPDAEFAATYYDHRTSFEPRRAQKRTWSLRSRSEFNVATEIAGQYIGGGGHAQSAGFEEQCPEPTAPWVVGAVFDARIDNEPGGLRFFDALPETLAIKNPPWLSAELRESGRTFNFIRSREQIAGHWVYYHGAPMKSDSQGEPARESPAEAYNRMAKWTDIIQANGWTLFDGDAEKSGRWRRPGKTDAGLSATTGFPRAGSAQLPCSMMQVFSSHAAPFQAGMVYSKFQAFALLTHGGDLKAAAQTIYDAGFGKAAGEPDTPATPEMVRDLLSLVGMEKHVPPAMIEGWQQDDREAVASWAGGIIAMASDNADVIIPALPLVLHGVCTDTGHPLASGRHCRECGCTDENCAACIAASGHPCWWVEMDLCSRCMPETAATP